MTISIGRAGLDSGATIENPQTQSYAGKQITWTGVIRSSLLEAVKACAQQLLGYIGNPDELWAPVVCGHDPSLTGFYKVLAVSVNTEPINYKTPYLFPYSVTVEQVPGYGKPVTESSLIGALRTNVSSITATNMTAYLLVPTNAVPSSTIATYSSEQRTDADSLVDNFFSLANPTLPITFQFALDPKDPTGTAYTSWYQAAAKIESQALDGSTYRTVIGRNIPYRTTVVQPGHDWRLSNSYIRVAPAVITGAAGSGCDITVSHWDGSAWDTAVRYTFTLATDNLAARGYTQVTVLRNDPAAVSIRLQVQINNRAWILDLTVRRGSRFVECRWSIDVAGVIIVARQATEAATAITGGIRATSNDASGNRYVLAAAQTTTNDLVNGKITSGSVTAYDFMIGSEVTGTSATGQGTAQNQIYQWICAQSETYRLVGR